MSLLDFSEWPLAMGFGPSGNTTIDPLDRWPAGVSLANLTSGKSSPSGVSEIVTQADFIGLIPVMRATNVLAVNYARQWDYAIVARSTSA